MRHGCSPCVLLLTGLNLLGVQASSRVNALLALGMGIVVVVFLGYAIRYIALVARPTGYAWLVPFYDPARFNAHLVLHGTSIAVLTYIGFDGISTMSEEVENPRRNIMLATVLTCLAIGLLSAVEVYVAQLAWPAAVPFPENIVDTAYVQVALRVGGHFLFQLLNATLLIANLGSGIAAQFGASRLLYGMGRANALPRGFFGAVSVRNNIPRNNVVLLGLITLGGCVSAHLREGRGVAQLRRFHRFHRRQCRGAHPLQVPLAREGPLPCRHSACRHRHLRLHLVQSQPQRQAAGRRLDHRRPARLPADAWQACG